MDRREGEIMKRLLISLVLFVGAGKYLLAAECVKDTQSARLRDFVNQTFIHGVPFSEAVQFRSNRDVETLTCLLNDPTEQPYLRNVVSVLGMGGNSHARQPLIKFLEQGSGVLPRDAFAAKSAAVVALGFLAPNDPDAMSYLQKSVDPAVWTERGVKWLPPFSTSPQERDADLSKHAILALGLSGDPNAANFLLSLQRGESLRLTSDFDDVIAEALKSNDMIQRHGIVAYEQRTQ